MNAYPAELIQHHYACMLVSGLLPSQSQIASPDLAKSKLTPIETREQPSIASESKSTASISPSGSNEIISATASSSASTSSSFSKAPTPAQAFPQVTRDLCEILSARGRSSAWDPSKSQSAVFHTVLVDNNVRLPPKKTRPTPRTLNATALEQHSSLASLQPRSPLSPLHPSSPLFPDGLIAPIWLRKHRELVPSVFVSFYCLAEQVSDTTTTETQSTEEKQSSNGTATQPLTGAELKKRDEDLIRVISDRKRALSERGIKFTVVLLTTRGMLESTALESRLSYIRRSSQLDSKASLFVLTPVSRSELGDFVTSLQGALYDSAQDYYREHYRRAKKKRSRYPPPASTVTQIMSAAAEIRGNPIKDNPLSKEGWLARSDYKLGTFAELTSNLGEGLTHYNSAYQALVNELLASTMLLPPRTKRWAEAKVLSDCLNFKICKIHLYRNDGESAWDQFKTHVKRFTELSQGWGIGEMTFEFWSWLGKQYRLMGDLLDLATRDVPGSTLPVFQVPIHFPDMPTFLLHPSHLPTPTVNGYIPPSHNPQHGNLAPPNDVAMNAQVVPANICQGAGGCFYLAGICAMERWQRFRRMVWEEENDSAKREDGAWTTLTQEKKIDHAAQAIEVFTKAHEVFKRFHLERQSLLVASKIAIAYMEGGQHEMALRFLERITKTYRAEGWSAQTVSLLLLSLECARSTKNIESEGRALWLLLSIQCPISTTQKEAARSALISWQSNPTKEGAKTITIDSGSNDGALFVDVAFARDQVSLDDQGSLFQLRLTCLVGHSLADLCFDSLILYLSGSSTAFIVKHKEDEHNSSLVELATISLDTMEETQEIGHANLRWSLEGTVRSLQGIIIPNKLGALLVEKVCLQGGGPSNVSLEFHLTRPEDESTLSYTQPKWMVKSNPPEFIDLKYREDRDGILVTKRSHKIQVEIHHDTEAYLEERFGIHLTISNNESFPLQCLAEASVSINAPESAQDQIWIRGQEDKQTGGRAEETELGILEAGSTLKHTIFLHCHQQSARNRIVEIVIRTVIPGDHTESRSSESLHSIDITVKQLFAPGFQAHWSVVRDSSLTLHTILARKPSITISDMDEVGSEGGSEMTVSTYAEGEVRSLSSIAAINVGLAVLAKEEILLKSVSLVLNESSKHLRISNKFDDSRIEKHSIEETWANGDRWGTVYDVEVLSETITGFPIEGDDASLRPTGQLCIEWKRQKDLTSELVNTSMLDVPLLLPPTLLSRIVVSIPLSSALEQPLIMLLSIVNPSKLSTDIFVVVDDAQSDFAVLSHKSFSVPVIAKSTRSVPIHVLSKSSSFTSNQAIRHLPRVRAWQRDRRIAVKKDDQSGEEVKQAPFTPIMNQQRGGGLPLDVQLRYSRPSSSSSSLSQQQQQQHSNGNHKTAIAQLQAETNKTGAWTIFTHSQPQTAT